MAGFGKDHPCSIIFKYFLTVGTDKPVRLAISF